MAETEGSSGFGTLLQRGDGAEGAGTKSKVTKGVANTQLVVGWDNAGTGGDGKQVSAIAAGNNTALSVAVSDAAVVITLATDGTATATSTVNDVLAKLYQDETFQSKWFGSTGAGNGTGILAAFPAESTTGGALGAELFTTIAEVTNISGPGIALELIDATHMESPDAFREYLPSLLDGSEVTFDLNYLPGNANQGGLRADQLARVRRNFRIVWTNTPPSTDAFAGYVTDFTPSAQIDDKLSASCTVKITGPVTRLE